MTLDEMQHIMAVQHAHTRLPSGSLHDRPRVRRLSLQSLKRPKPIFHFHTYWEAQPQLDAHTGEQIGWYDVLRGRSIDRHVVPQEPFEGDPGKYSWDQTFDRDPDRMRSWDK